MSEIERVSKTFTTKGGAGTSTAEGYLSTSSGGPSKLKAVKITYTGEPATTDVELIDRGGVNGTVLTRSNANTSGTFHPLIKAQDSTGADIAGVYTDCAVWGLTVKIAQGDNLKTVKIDAYFES